MFNELPKLFDRNFAVGFFLPAAVLTGGIWVVLGAHGLVSMPKTLEELGKLTGAVLAVLAVWLAALALLALNRLILRSLEGYPLQHFVDRLGRREHAWHTRCLRWVRRRFPRHRRAALGLQRRIDDRRAALRRCLLRRSRRHFRRDARALLRLQVAVDAARVTSKSDPWTPDGFSGRLARVAASFPDDEGWALPTRFGNLFRAFEVYSRVLYGLDAIPAWPHLQAVMPEHARRMLTDAKAQLDFCANLAAGGILLTFVHLGLGLWRWCLPEPWLVLAGITLAILGYQLALSAAAQFGAYVKSAFDLYRGELAKGLGLELPRSVEAERAMWSTVSRMMIYRSAARAGELSRYRAHRKNGA